MIAWKVYEKGGERKEDKKRPKMLKIMIYKFSIQWNASAQFKLQQIKNQKKANLHSNPSG
jgi:hypothetical protein